ncbi:gentisate 1,2-dioxygenase [Bradyrhizobium macuxiense]|uniref:Gentisate 1,2-dioxygenase n=1 Tax=Bradyrhizobium macuxiense TaxID=1755647 RepID=A0A560KX57_9BRAD|nr:cupin domain-containing protein [Bradyrhizobium macuxiense]TWB87826.1 gentisate 1,2-dioxygenase [Bradyrhizobium macuxiense]
MAQTTTDQPPERFQTRTVGMNLYPLWELTTLHQTGQPSPEAPCLWRWEEVQNLIEGAVQATSTTHAERRVLLMANPVFAEGLGKTKTTTTLQAAYQVLMPGESARPHRHTPNALRFMLEDGGETYTVVDGKECLMQRGDIVLTPANTWHSHFHKGKGRSVWFDALDSGLVGYLDTGFFEPGTNLRNFPETMPDSAFVGTGLSPVLPEAIPAAYSPRFRYPWSDTLAALAVAPVRDDGSAWLRLVNPAGGEMAMQTMDCYVVRIARTATRRQRSTSSAVCVVASGSGMTRFGDNELTWKERDIFTIPHWQWVSHQATSDSAELFIVTDRGFLRKLGYLRDEIE